MKPAFQCLAAACLFLASCRPEPPRPINYAPAASTATPSPAQAPVPTDHQTLEQRIADLEDANERNERYQPRRDSLFFRMSRLCLEAQLERNLAVAQYNKLKREIEGERWKPDRYHPHPGITYPVGVIDMKDYPFASSDSAIPWRTHQD